MSEPETDACELQMPEVAVPSGLAPDPEVSLPDQHIPPPRLWGPWSTIGWTLLCVLVFSIAQLIGMVLFLALRVALTGNTRLSDVGTNGNLLALATLSSTSASVGLIALIIWLRGYPIRDYLALRWPPSRSVLIALLGLAVVLVATDLSSYLAGRPLVPPFMVDVYRTSWLPALVVMLVVLAPVGEETIFRGFLYAGLAASRGGPVLAIVVSSITFTLMHGLQYDRYAIAGVAAMGFYLGIIRHYAGSLSLTMLLHALANGFATLELIVQEHWIR